MNNSNRTLYLVKIYLKRSKENNMLKIDVQTFAKYYIVATLPTLHLTVRNYNTEFEKDRTILTII